MRVGSRVPPFLPSSMGSFYGKQCARSGSAQHLHRLYAQLLPEQLEEQLKIEAHPEKCGFLGKPGHRLLAAQI